MVVKFKQYQNVQSKKVHVSSPSFPFPSSFMQFRVFSPYFLICILMYPHMFQMHPGFCSSVSLRMLLRLMCFLSLSTLSLFHYIHPNSEGKSPHTDATDLTLWVDPLWAEAGVRWATYRQCGRLRASVSAEHLQPPVNSVVKLIVTSAIPWLDQRQEEEKSLLLESLRPSDKLTYPFISSTGDSQLSVIQVATGQFAAYF